MFGRCLDGVWMVSVGVWIFLGVSAWGLRVSGDELMQNILAQIYVGHVSLDIAFYSSAR